ncbi:hypothetical protein NST54_14715 [Caldifermentibacillus hisashii]|uniref:hypothetical protein n=1 Tax=Caldifermentibacillus hisashii TaxID=996558 RepID=UPI0034D79E55
MPTRFVLVTILRRKTPFFGDETYSRRHFEAENPIFWRRNLFSSPFRAGKPHFLATKPILVAILSWKKCNFADEIHSRRHLEPENPIFWRRNLFSSPFCGGKPHFLTTSLNLVTILSREMLKFSDEIRMGISITYFSSNSISKFSY